MRSIANDCCVAFVESRISSWISSMDLGAFIKGIGAAISAAWYCCCCGAGLKEGVGAMEGAKFGVAGDVGGGGDCSG